MNAEVLPPQGEDVRLAKVTRRNVEYNGKVIGDYNKTLTVNTILYDFQFPDGAIKTYSANITAEKIFTQVDSDVYHNQLLERVFDHSKDKQEVEKKDQWIVTKCGRRSMSQTTIGWKFRVKWKDGTVTLTSIKDIKEPNTIEVNEYVTDRRIQDEPAFSWWVPFTLRKRDRIIAAVNSIVRKSTHKYGIEIPTSVEHTEEIDKRDHNNFWQDAINLEISNIGIAFKILERGGNLTPGYKKSSGHMIYTVKMDFNIKS